MMFRLLFVSSLLWWTSNGAHSRHRRVVNSSNGDSTKYDRSITTFSEDGRLQQVEYSMEASLRHSRPILAFLDHEDDDSSSCRIVIIIPSTTTNNNGNNYNIHRLHKDIWMITSGLTGDGLALARYLRNSCQDHYRSYGEVPTVREVASTMARSIQHDLTQSAGARPLGCQLWILGKEEGGEYTTPDDKGEPNMQKKSILAWYQSEPGGIMKELSNDDNANNEVHVLGRFGTDIRRRFQDFIHQDENNNNDATQRTTIQFGNKIKYLWDILADLTTDTKESSEQNWDVWVMESASSAKTDDVNGVLDNADNDNGLKVCCFKGVSKETLDELEQILSREKQK